MKNILNWMVTYYILAVVVFVGIVDPAKAYKYRLQKVITWATYPVDHLLDQRVSTDSPSLRRGLRYYKTLTKLSPDLIQAYGMMGYCYFYLHKDEKAIRTFSKAIEEEPRLYWHQYNLGLIYYQRKDYVKAAEYFRQVVSLTPKQLLMYSVYSPLSRLAPKSRKAFFQLAYNFAETVYGNARTYLALCLLKKEQVQLPEDSGPQHLVIHPWVKYIPVGKEGYYD